MTRHKIVSDDPEVRKLQGFSYGLEYCAKRGISGAHLRVVLAVKILSLSYGGNKFPKASAVANQTGFSLTKTKMMIDDLLEHRILHEEIPIYGDLTNSTYRLAAKGGSMIKKVLAP